MSKEIKPQRVVLKLGGEEIGEYSSEQIIIAARGASDKHQTLIDTVNKFNTPSQIYQGNFEMGEGDVQKL